MAQVDVTVGDFMGNIGKIKGFIEKAREAQCAVVIFPELAICGYPPQDLLYEGGFLEKNRESLQAIAQATDGITAIVGFVDHDPKACGRDGTVAKYNAAAIIRNRVLIGVRNKTLLPTYDVFDEDRYFTPAQSQEPIGLDGLKLGTEICEDLWDENYPTKVTDILRAKGSQIIVNLSASPFHVGKRLERLRLLREKAANNQVMIFYVNLVGGQDELVFDGESMAVDESGRLLALGKQFEEDLIIVDTDLARAGAEVPIPAISRESEIYGALVLGVRDYCSKTGFRKTVIGLSGGIDSSLAAAIAVDALGRENVLGVSMPSRYSSEHSKGDAMVLAQNLGLQFFAIPIESVFKSFEEVLSKPFANLRRDITEENLQARIRGMILMAISNKLGHLVLSTGNKTELALGYCTLYGDMCGGLAVIGDVSKTQVYSLARYVNEKAGREIIPRSCFDKKPSAELREMQFDPFDYDVISPLVDDIVEERLGMSELLQKGYGRREIEDSMGRMIGAEYKRRQAPPVIKITPKAFGIGRKYPIVNRYKPIEAA